MSDEDQKTLARTIYGEARGQGVVGMQDVASVIMNRFRTGYRGKTSISDVCLDPYQFSCWNVGDPNRAKIAALEPGTGNAVFDQAYQIAGDAMAGRLHDRTGGARHYHTTVTAAFWADPAKITLVENGHVFYAGIA